MQTCLGDVGVAVDANAVLPVLDALQGGIDGIELGQLVLVEREFQSRAVLT